MSKNIDEQIFNAFKELFDKCPKLNYISFWVQKYRGDDKPFINDEDIDFNKKRWDWYVEAKADKNLDIIMQCQTLIEKFDGDEKGELNKQFHEMNVKYTAVIRQHPFLKALDDFDFTSIDTEIFNQYMGKRFPWDILDIGVFFTIARDGTVDYTKQ